MAHRIQWLKAVLVCALWKINACHYLQEKSEFCDVAYLSRRDPNLVYTPNVTQIQFGRTLQFSCLPGYALHGQEYGECMSDGRISISGEFFCKDLGIRCGFDQLDKAHLTVTPKRTEYHYGEVVGLQCNEGFVLRGPSTVSCTEDRLFDVPSNLACEAEIKCHKTNSILNVPHLVVTPDKEGYLYNETVSLQCRDGYTLQGSSQATCLQNFEAPNDPSCLASYCDASWIYNRLSGVQYMSEEDPSRLEVGESIYFSCEKGYRLRGASSVKCLPTGDLEGTGLLTECEKISCSKDSLVHGTYGLMHVSPDKDSYDFNETVYFHCGEEQMVYGSHSARCAQNGWEYDSPSLPLCGQRHCDTSSLHQEGMYTTPSIGGKVDVGSRIFINCYHGYFLRCADNVFCMPRGRLEPLGMMCHCEANSYLVPVK